MPDRPPGAKRPNLSTKEAAKYCGMNRNTFAAHVQHHNLQPAAHYDFGDTWSPDYLDRWLVVRQKNDGRPTYTTDPELLLNRMVGGQNPAQRKQLLALIINGLATGKLKLDPEEARNAFSQVRDYLLHHAGDWLPVKATPPVAQLESG